MDSVKQSAALCLLRLYRTSPDLVPMGDWTSRVVHLLNDQHLVGASGPVCSPSRGAASFRPVQCEQLCVTSGMLGATSTTRPSSLGAPVVRGREPLPWGQGGLDRVSGSPCHQALEGLQLAGCRDEQGTAQHLLETLRPLRASQGVPVFTLFKAVRGLSCSPPGSGVQAA